MLIFLDIFFSVGIVSSIVYSSLALGYRHVIAGEAQTNFSTFLLMYKIAPDKWEYNQYYHYLYYYPDGQDKLKRECVYMNSYFEHLQLYFWYWAKKKEREKEKTNKKTGELYECFLRDALGTNKEEKKPEEETI